MQLRLYVARCRPTVKDGTVNAAKPRDSVKKKSRGFNRGSVKQKRKEKEYGNNEFREDNLCHYKI